MSQHEAGLLYEIYFRRLNKSASGGSKVICGIPFTYGESQLNTVQFPRTLSMSPNEEERVSLRRESLVSWW